MDKISLLIAPIEVEFSCFKNHYRSLFSSATPSVDVLLKFLLQRNGKMMRPILLLLTAKCFGEVREPVYNLASAIELLHQGSLIHDDVVDESNVRRGKASANAVFDNRLAVLLGDYVVSMALCEVVHTGSVEAINSLTTLIGTLSEGEIIQLNTLVQDDLSEELYFDIIRKKTASLFSISSFLSAILSGASNEDAERMRKIGEIIGLCFQIRDDIFDYFSDSTIGKPSGLDLRDGKITLPAIYALNNSSKDWSGYIKRVREGSATADEISEIIDFTVNNRGVEYARNKMQELKEQAIELLPANISTTLRSAFIEYIELIINRDR